MPLFFPKKRVIMPSKEPITIAAVVTLLEDYKAQNIAVLPVSDRTPHADTFIIATGTSQRHLNALSRQISAYGKARAPHRPKVEGEQVCDWQLVDLEAIVVHIMTAEARDYYQLEALWSRVEDARLTRDTD